jgi:Tfp pilus assembly PilM family ATPase
MKSGLRIVLDLSATRIDVVGLRRGHPVAARRVAVTLRPDIDEWMASLHEAARPLRAVIESLGAVGAPTTVLYRSPTQTVDLSSFPLTPSEARRAAIQQCLEALPYPEDLAIYRSAALGRGAGGGQPLSHALAVADRDDVLQRLRELVEAAGLTLQRAVPLDAITMGRLVARGLRQRGGESAWLSIGESSSFFVVAKEGSLAFARQISIGCSAMITSLTRPVLAPGVAPIELDHAAARRVLQQHGLPAPETLVHEALGLYGSQLIPLLQPVLQRFLVELRQSLRFGLSQEQRRGLSLRITGPGAGVRGLARLIHDELSVPVVSDPTLPEHWEPAAAGSELAEALPEGRLMTALALEPRSASRQRARNRVQRCLWTGAAAALVVVGVDTLRYEQAVESLRRQRDALAAEVSGQEALQATTTRLLSVVVAMEKLQSDIEREVVRTPDFPAVMHELGLLAPSSLRLNSIRISREKDGVEGLLAGFAAPDGAGHSRLETFIDSMRRSPLFADVNLENVQVTMAGGVSGHGFQVGFTLVPAPAAIAGVTAEREP